MYVRVCVRRERKASASRGNFLLIFERQQKTETKGRMSFVCMANESSAKTSWTNQQGKRRIESNTEKEAREQTASQDFYDPATSCEDFPPSLLLWLSAFRRGTTTRKEATIAAVAFSSERPVRPFARGTFRSVKEAEARLVVVVREAVVLIVVIVVVPLRDVVVVVVVVVVLVIVVLVAVVVVRVSGVGFGAEN